MDVFSRSPLRIRSSRPISQHMVTGLVLEKEGAWLIDYRQGIHPFGRAPSARTVPPQLAEQGRMSLWNLCLEIHTGRIFEPLVGMFYILYVPILGLGMLVVLISGWIRLSQRKPKKK